MPKQFRKKPVVIEAERFTVNCQQAAADWCNGKLCGTLLPAHERKILINTLEGELTASVGDWIIKGVSGEFYPCKPDIFALTYEAV